jgi:dephospho-CoA kinase
VTESDTATPPPSPEKRTFVVGLTGGVGSGKSTVADAFSALGVPVIDADQLARELVAPGQAALDEIVAAFGANSIMADGQLDRDAMRQRIYADPAQKSRLESILHPRIRQRIRTLLAGINAPYTVVVIPLLLETNQVDLVNRILVVDTPEKEQLKRVAARDSLSDNAVMAIIDAQADRKTRLDAADDVIVNDKDVSALIDHVQELHKHYMDISHEH